MQNYARFLIGQPRRPGDTAAALEQYRAILVEANGVDSATLLDPLQMRIEWEQARGEFAKAAASARELLELQESLTGNTSAAYLHSLETAAAIYEAAGDTARALPLLRQTIAIADLLATPLDDSERSRTRMNTALALARLGQFDEAETLGEAAVKLCEPSRTPIEPLTQQLDQIRQMHKSAAK